MTHAPRLDDPGTYHHAYARGVLGMPLFLDDLDRHVYLGIVERVLRGTGTRCFAWSLMTNHTHLGLEVGSLGLSKPMQMINAAFARHFRRRHGGKGHVFQGPFGSKRVAGEDHLLGLVAYIHLNAVKAGIVRSVSALGVYPWSGHAALMGTRPPRFLEVERTLALFGPNKREARRALESFLAGLAQTVPGGDEPDPLAAVQALALTLRQRLRASLAGVDSIVGPPQRGGGLLVARTAGPSFAPMLASEGWDLERLIPQVCLALDVDPDDLRSGRRTRAVSRARAVVGFLGHRYLEISGRELARATGVAGSSMSHAITRGATLTQSLGLSAATVFETPELNAASLRPE